MRSLVRLQDGTTVRITSGGMRRLAERQLPKQLEAVMRELS